MLEINEIEKKKHKEISEIKSLFFVKINNITNSWQK
jgi:hypothetical protein